MAAKPAILAAAARVAEWAAAFRARLYSPHAGSQSEASPPGRHKSPSELSRGRLETGFLVFSFIF